MLWKARTYRNVMGRYDTSYDTPVKKESNEGELVSIASRMKIAWGH